MNHQSRMTRMTLAAMTVIAVFVIGGCADHENIERDEATGSVPRLTPGEASTVSLSRGEATSIRVPTGPPIVIELPKDSSAVAASSQSVDDADQNVQIEIKFLETALGFPVASAGPADPAEAEEGVRRLVEGINSSGYSITAASVVAWASVEGSTKANLVLSEGRANWMCAALRASGVDPAVLTCSGQGEHDVGEHGPGPEDRTVDVSLSIVASEKSNAHDDG